MKKLTDKQVAALTNPKTYDSGGNDTEIGEALGLSRITVARWRKKVTGKAARAPYGSKSKKASATRDALARLVKIQIDEDPEYLAHCLEGLDFKKLTGA